MYATEQKGTNARSKQTQGLNLAPSQALAKLLIKSNKSGNQYRYSSLFPFTLSLNLASTIHSLAFGNSHPPQEKERKTKLELSALIPFCKQTPPALQGRLTLFRRAFASSYTQCFKEKWGTFSKQQGLCRPTGSRMRKVSPCILMFLFLIIYIYITFSLYTYITYIYNILSKLWE